MREKKNLSGNIRFAEDVTQKNMNLMKLLRESDEIESAWFYNTRVYGKSKDGTQVKFDIGDNITQKLREGRESREFTLPRHQGRFCCHRRAANQNSRKDCQP